jgi:hypothetical protein
MMESFQLPPDFILEGPAFASPQTLVNNNCLVEVGSRLFPDHLVAESMFMALDVLVAWLLRLMTPGVSLSFGTKLEPRLLYSSVRRIEFGMAYLRLPNSTSQSENLLHILDFGTTSYGNFPFYV